MTGEEFITITKTAKKYGMKCRCRTDVEEPAYVLYRMLQSIGRKELADEVFKFYCEMEDMEYAEVKKIIEEHLFN